MASRSRKRKSGILKTVLIRMIMWVVGLGLVGGIALFLWIDHTVQQRFYNRLWDIPVHIYGSSFEIFPGLSISVTHLEERLLALGYRRVDRVQEIGEFNSASTSIDLVTRPFEFWDGPQPPRDVHVRFNDGIVESVIDRRTGASVNFFRLKPHLIGSLSQSQHQDRFLVRLEEMPPLLLETLISVEDRRFVSHWGVDAWAILRAAWSNLRAGKIVQGGSTLTQQLVKNVFGRNDRTYERKLLEAATALVLEYRLDKRQILQAYCNEVYLGQDGKRAIHGFGLGSQHFFGRPVGELNPNEIAQLVGMIKAPTSYNPVRHPESAKKRRAVVLNVMKESQLISDAQYQQFVGKDLKLRSSQARQRQAYSSFIDVVFRQLSDRLDDADLKSSALSVFTTMDIQIQRAAELALSEELAKIEKSKGLPDNSLEGGIVVLRPDSGEIFAVVGSRNASVGTFNRAINARRPVGSLLKPFIYLSAFLNSDEWTLGSVISDRPVTYRVKGGQDWSPNNFDDEFIGDITILDALAQSRNIPAVKVGMQVGVKQVAETVRKLGADVASPVYPAMLLGALELSPMEVARIYQVLANFGYQAEFRTISAITASARAIGRTKASAVKAVLPRSEVYLALFGMQEAVRNGTGKGLLNTFSPNLKLAGKTGTTDDFRDSWFVGLSGNLLGVVWIGRDDNKPTGLTGASGAMRVWASMMKRVNLQALHLPSTENIQLVNIDKNNGLRAASGCGRVGRVPFLAGTVPRKFSSC